MKERKRAGVKPYLPPFEEREALRRSRLNNMSWLWACVSDCELERFVWGKVLKLFHLEINIFVLFFSFFLELIETAEINLLFYEYFLKCWSSRKIDLLLSYFHHLKTWISVFLTLQKEMTSKIYGWIVLYKRYQAICTNMEYLLVNCSLLTTITCIHTYI